MQFHHHGYVSGDPRIQDAAGSGIDRPADLPDEVDVLIVGSGPAGMLLAAQMSQFPDVTTRIIERRDGRLVLGQADGIQPRSVETFQAFGFAERIVAEAYNIAYMNFWGPDPENPRNIVRTTRTEDYAFKISEFPHLIVNQARVLDYFAEAAAHGPGRIVPDYGVEFVGLDGARGGGVSGRGAAAAHVGRARRGGARPCARSTSSAATAPAAACARRSGARIVGDFAAPRLGRHGCARRTPTSPIGARNARSTPWRATSCTSRARAATSADVHRSRRGRRRTTTTRCARPRRGDHPQGERHPASLLDRCEAGRLAQRLRGRPPRDRQVRRRPGRRGARSAGVPDRRRLPHAQRQGRAGHERVDAGRIQPGLEARTRADRPQPGVAARDVLRRAPAGRPAAHRLRPRVVLADGAQARRDLRPAGSCELLPGDRGVPLRIHDAVRPVTGGQRRVAPGARGRLPRRQAVQVRRGGPGLRRQRRAPRASRAGRRTLARLRVRGCAVRRCAVGALRVGGVDGLARVADRAGTRRQAPTSTPCST